MIDTVQDPDVPIMNLCIKRIEGINEPVKFISSAGFAVGARTDKVYGWKLDYEEQQVMEDAAGAGDLN